jgi:phage tail protein X
MKPVALPAQPAPNPAPSSASPDEKKTAPVNVVAVASVTEPSPAKLPGFHLKLLPGDTVESVAAVLFPGQRALQQALVQQVLTGNPTVFPDGRSREIPAGTVLWFPDLPALRKTVPATASRTDRTPPAGGSDKVRAPRESPKSSGAVTLRRALALGDRPGPQECKQLMDLCGAPVATAPAADGKFNAVESGMQQLHLRQDGINQQLQGLEQSLLALQKTINNLPAHAAPPPMPAPAPAPTPPEPPRVEIRTVTQSEPVEWYVWLALASAVAAVGIGGFLYGRRGSFSRGLQETDEQLDRMLAGAADVMREFEANPVRVPPPPRITSPPAPRPVVQRPVTPRPAPLPEVIVPPPPPPVPEITFSEPDATTDASPPTAVEPMHITDIAFEPAVEPPVVLHPPAGSDPGPQVAGLSNEVLFEMDQAMDNTRSMFTDVDRFIALGRIQNALSLLQFQVHKDPTDRDSWIKLLAIYRQEKMDTELTKAAREFRNNFPNESSPV